MVRTVRFPSTFWTAILSRPTNARARVYGKYRTPVLHFIMNQGFTEHDAEDLTQDVFMVICRPGFLRSADREKGKFRSLVLGVTRRVILKARERGRVRRARSLKDIDTEGWVESIRKEDPSDGGFARLWKDHLLRLARERLMRETGDSGPRYYDVLVMSGFQQMSYPEIAKSLGATVTDVTNWKHQAKKKIREYILEFIREYSSSGEEYREELSAIRRLLSG